MFIHQLKINGFRCYDAVDLNFNQAINVFYGANGSGKTSILESLFCLSTGKSFRSKKNKALVNSHTSSFTLHTTFTNTTSKKLTQYIGYSFDKHSNKKRIKINHSSVKHQSETAHALPVVSIDPESYLFIDKAPQFRRSFLDWLVFHVKPEYLKIWTQTNRCQKQLNTLYKAKQINLLKEWEQQYILCADKLNNLRLEVFASLVEKVKEKISAFAPEISNLNIQYSQGWTKDTNLKELLINEREKNLKYGNLFSGIHKMDIRCKVNQLLAQDVLSRGQKKIISIIFYLCYIELFTEITGIDPVICLDDLDAELDENKTNLICEFIKKSNNQIFITTVDKNKVTSLFDQVAVFHVKHGKVESL